MDFLGWDVKSRSGVSGRTVPDDPSEVGLARRIVNDCSVAWLRASFICRTISQTAKEARENIAIEDEDDSEHNCDGYEHIYDAIQNCGVFSERSRKPIDLPQADKDRYEGKRS